MEVKIVLDAEGSDVITTDDVAKGRVKEAELTAITALPRGMEGGGTSVAFVGELKGSGKKVFLQTSLKMFQMAAAAFTGRYGDETGQVRATIDGDKAVIMAVDPDEDAN